MEEINHLNNIPYHLMMEEIEGTISLAGAQELESWKTASVDHMHCYQEFIGLSDQAELLGVYQTLDENSAWEKFNPSVIPAEAEIRQLNSSRKKVFSLFKWAAAIIVVTLGSLFMANQGGWVGSQTVSTGKNEQQKLILPDGTVVFMNANTTLSYHKKGFQTNRKVKFIKGEAYFNVVHEEKNPFSITSDELQVNDLGTSFSLKMEPTQIIVVVNSGLVSLEHEAKAEKILLSPQDRGVFNRDTQQISQGKNDNPNYKSWYDKQLQYLKTPLSQVASDLKELYGVEINFQDVALKDRKLTASFKNKSADEIIQIIGTTFQLKVTKKESIFVLSN